MTISGNIVLGVLLRRRVLYIQVIKMYLCSNWFGVCVSSLTEFFYKTKLFSSMKNKIDKTYKSTDKEEDKTINTTRTESHEW